MKEEKKEIGRGTAVLSRWVEKRGGRREGGGEVFCWLLEGGKKREGERRLCGRGEEKKSVVYVRRKMRKSCFFAGEEKKREAVGYVFHRGLGDGGCVGGGEERKEKRGWRGGVLLAFGRREKKRGRETAVGRRKEGVLEEV